VDGASNCNSQTGGDGNTINVTCIVIQRENAEEEILEATGTSLDQPVINLLDQIQNSIINQQQTGGVYGVVKLTWIDNPQIAFAIMNGSYGILITAYQTPNGTIETIEQNISLTSNQDGNFLIGSNPRFTGTNTPHPAYAPDIFRLQYNQYTGLYFIDAVCDLRYYCSRIMTQSIF
jgi:hypothetical protein